MASIIPEQRTPVFAGKPYEIGVEQTSSKSYTYMLYDGDSIIERWSGDKSPRAMNKNSAFINDSCKKIGEVKVDVDGTIFTYTKDQVNGVLSICELYLSKLKKKKNESINTRGNA